MCNLYLRTVVGMDNNQVKHYLIILITILFFLIKIRKIVDKTKEVFSLKMKTTMCHDRGSLQVDFD